jgi:hypothetical protein
MIHNLYQTIRSEIQSILNNLRQTANNWPLLTLISLSLYFLLIGLTQSNSYSIYMPHLLLWGLIVIPFLYILVAILTNRLILPKLLTAPKQSRMKLALLSLMLTAIFAWIFPTPLPAISKQHTVHIISTGTKNSTSQGAEIEIYQARLINGTLVPLDKFKVSGDWQIKNKKLVSSGTNTPAVAELSGVLPDGIQLWFNFNDQGGKAIVLWDDQSVPLDLFSKQKLTGPVSFTSPPWQGASPWEIILLLLCAIIFYLGAYFCVFLFCFIFEFELIRSRLTVGLIILLMYVSVLAAYFQVKSSYLIFNGERIFNDTPSYVQTAQKPINSLEFWAGERTFTLPLLYKLNGLSLKNFFLSDNLKRMANVQTWISISCWVALGLAVAANMRHKWLGPLAFGLVLLFSLSLDISLWDRLMLSESISFSLFALLLAAWLFLELMPARWLRQLVGYFYLVFICLISVLYSFARDSNIYFLAVSAGFFTLMLIIKKTRPETRKHYIIYVIFIMALFIVQNISFQRGDRWVPHVYDNLARRIVSDPQGLAYFKAAGMPVNEKLLNTPDQATYEYTKVFMQDPDMQSLRDWVNAKGQSTYYRYIITHPAVSILAPIGHFGNIINGGNLEYRYPRYPYQPIPPLLAALDNRIYPRQWWGLIFISGLVLAGGWLYLTKRDSAHPAWLVVLLLVLTIIPLLFIYWNGNPLEIERHVIQLGVQYRLGGWMAVILLVDLYRLETTEAYTGGSL